MSKPNNASSVSAFRRMLLAAAVVAATLAALPMSSASAQDSGLVDDSTYVFGLDGAVVTWEGDWEFDPSSSGEFDGYETASLITPLAGLLIGEIQSGTPLDLDAFLAVVLDTVAADSDEFITVERSATDVVSYSLDAAVIDGIPAALFTFVQPNLQTGTIVFTSLLSEMSSFADNIADAQGNVTISGRVALEGIDGQVLEDLLPDVQAGGGSQEPNETEETDDRETSDDDEDEVDERPTPQADDEEDADENNDRTGGAEIDDELAGLGIVEVGLYESPQFGSEIEWGGDWELNEDFLSSDEDEEVDNIGLATSGGEAVVLVTFFPADDATPADYAAFWESDEFVEENVSAEAEVLLADSSRDEGAVLIADPLDDGGELWTLRQAYSVDGGDAIAVVVMIGLDDDFIDLLEEAQDDIEIDGDPVLSFFSIEEIEDAA